MPFLFMLNKLLNNKRLFITLFVFMLIAVSWQSLVPKPLDAFQYTSDKTLHFIGWFSLGISLLLGINKKYILMACCLLFIYSIGIEIGQHFIPGRFFSLLDIVANGSGIIAAWLVKYLIKV